jgi:hypothetical protein
MGWGVDEGKLGIFDPTVLCQVNDGAVKAPTHSLSKKDVVTFADQSFVLSYQFAPPHTFRRRDEGFKMDPKKTTMPWRLDLTDINKASRSDFISMRTPTSTTDHGNVAHCWSKLTR